MTIAKHGHMSHAATRWLRRAAWAAAVVAPIAGWLLLGPPPMQRLTASALADAQQRWQAHGADSYHLVVRVRPPRLDVELYDVVVADGVPVRIERNGEDVRPEDGAHHDFSVGGLFALLREDLRLGEVPMVGDTPPLEMRARFEPETGRLIRYRRTLGSTRRRVLMVEVLEYQPLPAGAALLVAAPARARTDS